MEEGSKKRLVGAAIVVVLAVIFLPMLLEEPSYEPNDDTDFTIPPRPRFGPEPSLSEPSVPVAREHEPPPVAYEPESAPIIAEPTPIIEDVEPEPIPNRSTAARAEPEPEATRTPSLAAPPAQSGWIVQVASLKELERADSVKSDLIAKGFPAFIERAEVSGQTYYRVRVGPKEDRSATEAMASALSSRHGYGGSYVARYP